MSELAMNLEYHEPVREKFVVDNDMKAEWCLSKIRSAKKDADREIEELTRQMEFYKARMDQVKHDYEEEKSFFEEMLHGYFLKRVDDGFVKSTKTKVGYKLPTGELVLKHREPEYKRKDDAATIKWLEENEKSSFVKVKKELDWAGLKKTVMINGTGVVDAETGEAIPGIEVAPREDEFAVEVK